MPLRGHIFQNAAGTRDWLRARTLELLRWAAILGQLAAVLAAEWAFNLDLPLSACFALIGLSALVNLGAQSSFVAARRLSEAEALAFLGFDTLQLGLLLGLTGGLSNPFALLLLVPVTISATALTLRSTLALGIVVALAVGVMLRFSLPLRLDSGMTLALPALLELGYALSLLVGTAFLAIYAGRVAQEIRVMSDALLAVQMALSREQKLTDLGGVVAAAAHELGTPLATIKLVSSELLDELAGQPALAADAALIREQADRCRDILRSMGQAGKDDLHMRQAPLGELLRQAAEPHMGRGKTVTISLLPEPGQPDRPPLVQRRPEVIHGIRNLVQNAVDFAGARVWLDGAWGPDSITLQVADDGQGFPPALLGRIGDPFLRRRSAPPEPLLRPEYEGMGLGLFIAKTLLERTGAELTFANGHSPFLDRSEAPDRCGALVTVTWPRAQIEARPEEAIGANPELRA